MIPEVTKVAAPPKHKRAVGYVRVSTSEQAERGYSIDAQIATIKDYARHHNLEITHMYIDRGVSGKSIKGRVQMQLLLQDAANDQFDAVIVWKNSRIARNVSDLMSFVDVFDANGISFFSISEQFEITTATGRMMLQIMGSFNEFERNNIAENVKLGMKRRAREGYPNVGAVLGYEPTMGDDGKRNLVIAEPEADTVKLIFQRCAMGNGYRAIANYLNQMGYKTKRGNAFSTIAVKDVLHNPLYIGRVRYNRFEDWEKRRRRGRSDAADVIDVEGNHPAIIDQRLWDDVQRQLGKTSRAPQWDYKGQNVLTGLLRCPKCGGPMMASNTTNTLKDGTKKRIRYYSCANFRNKGASVCHANSIRADDAESLVAQKLQQVVAVPDIAKGVVDNLIAGQDEIRETLIRKIDLANQQIKVLDDKVERMEALFELEPELAKEALRRKEQLLVKEQEIQAEVAVMKDQLGHVDELPKLATVQWLLELVAEVCRGKDAKLLKELYRVFIEKITFNKKQKLVYVTMNIDQDVVDRLAQESGAEGHRSFCIQPIRLVL